LLNITLIRFLGGVSLIMRLEVSSLSITTKLVGPILVGRKYLSNSSSEVCIGQPCLKMPTHTVRVALGISRSRKLVGEI